MTGHLLGTGLALDTSSIIFLIHTAPKAGRILSSFLIRTLQNGNTKSFSLKVVEQELYPLLPDSKPEPSPLNNFAYSLVCVKKKKKKLLVDFHYLCFCFFFSKKKLGETGKIITRNKNRENCFYIKNKVWILYTTETGIDILLERMVFVTKCTWSILLD